MQNLSARSLVSKLNNFIYSDEEIGVIERKYLNDAYLLISEDLISVTSYEVNDDSVVFYEGSCEENVVYECEFDEEINFVICKGFEI